MGGEARGVYEDRPLCTMGERRQKSETVTREYTINLHKLLHKRHLTFKERAPKAVKAIRTFAAKEMKTSDVRLDVKLNKAVWSRGIKSVPRRMRIQISRKRNDDEDAKEAFYSYVTAVEAPNGAKGLQTKVIED